MSDEISLFSPTTEILPFLGRPRFFNGLLTKHHSDTETALMSPTSILENSSSFLNPCGYDRNLPKSPNPSQEVNKNSGTEAIGLALIDSLDESKTDSDSDSSKPINRKVLFRSKLNIQVPTINPTSLSPTELPKSPVDFGIKTRNSQFLSPLPETPAKNFTRLLSLKEMELSEEYTCVITHGPNPKTTHIFDNCVVESCCGENVEISDDKKMDCGAQNDITTSAEVNLLSSGRTCQDSLGYGKDIYVCRAENSLLQP